MLPVRLSSVHIFEPVFFREMPGRKRLPRFLMNVWVTRQCDHRPPDVVRCLGTCEVRVLLCAVSPIFFVHTEVLEHHFAAQKPWSECESSDVRVLQLFGLVVS